MKNFYCLNCNNDFEVDGLCICPHCGAVGDDLEELPEENPHEDIDLTEEEIEELYLKDISNKVTLIGAQ